ncbi:DUF1684 domain-containing protein [Arundinibacter roseus]|uniref:DUF1684 domain-containing protein n=1 Tax=Arundinibacter roseus TaxID=2070510 RepID=A0A4R4KEL8_9BACT|nr:DUF1684 domain-containing protein [Arundinibacter roseus]TDB65226.1 DUF1684 domain-containing protein [Arundinibacter roseus]
MFKNKIIRWSTLAMLLAILTYFFVETFQSNTASSAGTLNENITAEEHTAEIELQRKQKDELFRTSEESPIEEKATFHGLHYYEPSLAHRVVATLTPYEGAEKELKISYTDGTSDTYERLAYADFTVNGSAQRLLLLKNESVISVLFRDQTSGEETYGGGRYIDIPVEEMQNNSLIIDFNKAYNPYCAYAPDFACPLPPAENTLTVAIAAGEKYVEEKH